MKQDNSFIWSVEKDGLVATLDYRHGQMHYYGTMPLSQSAKAFIETFSNLPMMLEDSPSNSVN